MGDRSGAIEGLEAFLVRANAAGSGLSIVEAVTSLADIALATGDYAAASALVEPVIDEVREVAAPGWVGQLLRALGAAKRIAGELDSAQAVLDEATALVTPIGNDWLLALIESEQALITRERGETAQAEDLLHSALSRQVRHDLKPGIAATLDELGRLALDADSTNEAVRCFAAADALRAAIGLARRPFDDTERAPHVDGARDLLGEEAFDQLWNEAANLSLGEMIEYVSRARGERKRPLSGWDSLTPTELRIVTLVSSGLTNPQIAERMFIARGTVKVHLSHIFAKLAVTTRAQLATQATKRGLAAT
jgi:ATP/maltotriose-dependent transcriptional regulator MalT